MVALVVVPYLGGAHLPSVLNHASGRPSLSPLHTGVALGQDGDTLWILQRGSRVWDGATYAPDGQHLSEAVLAEGPIAAPVVMELDKETGAVLRSWGAGLLYMPHSIISDRDGNIWVTDVGLHQVSAQQTLPVPLVGPGGGDGDGGCVTDRVPALCWCRVGGTASGSAFRPSSGRRGRVGMAFQPQNRAF